MPFWSSPEPYAAMIKRDPGRLKIALSHTWGDYRATPHIKAELERVGRFLEGLGHQVDYALPSIDYTEAFAAQTSCYISNFAVVIGNMKRKSSVSDDESHGVWRPSVALFTARRTRLKVSSIGMPGSFAEASSAVV